MIGSRSLPVLPPPQQLAELDHEKDAQNNKFLVMSTYLDIQKIINQKNVYLNNRKVTAESAVLRWLA